MSRFSKGSRVIGWGVPSRARVRSARVSASVADAEAGICERSVCPVATQDATRNDDTSVIARMRQRRRTREPVQPVTAGPASVHGNGTARAPPIFMTLCLSGGRVATLLHPVPVPRRRGGNGLQRTSFSLPINNLGRVLVVQQQPSRRLSSSMQGGVSVHPIGIRRARHRRPFNGANSWASSRTGRRSRRLHERVKIEQRREHQNTDNRDRPEDRHRMPSARATAGSARFPAFGQTRSSSMSSRVRHRSPRSGPAASAMIARTPHCVPLRTGARSAARPRAARSRAPARSTSAAPAPARPAG